MPLIVPELDANYEVKIGKDDEQVILTLRPLQYRHKQVITGVSTKMQGGELQIDGSSIAFYSLKYALVSVVGFSNPDGSPFQIERNDGEDYCTDDCIDRLFNTPINTVLIYAGAKLISGIPTEILDQTTGLPMEGVEVIPPITNVKKNI